jgi:hypothetical protein
MNGGIRMAYVRTIALVAFTVACTNADTKPAVETETAGESKSGDAQSSTALDDHLISRNGVGRIRTGMTLDEARRALPTATFARTSDGDGLALVEVTLAEGESVNLWADEPDPDSAIAWSNRIRWIETFSPAFRTAEGVHPGALVTDVEAVYGRISSIDKSDIESREFIRFESQPPYLTLRLDYTGVFPEGSRTTKEFRPGATILSISISSR